MNLDKFLNSKIVLLVLGFILTGVVGTFLNHQFQNEVWKRQAQHEIAKRQLDQAQEAIEQVLLHANKRFYLMQKVFWSLESFKQDEAIERWEEYSNVKDEWNIMIRNYRSKIKILVSPDLSWEGQILSVQNLKFIQKLNISKVVKKYHLIIYHRI